jgi:hypothetical protein
MKQKIRNLCRGLPRARGVGLSAVPHLAEFRLGAFPRNPSEKWRHVLHGIALIYLAYVVRAIRWKIFLRPVRPEASSASLISPTVIGFTGLALLGRPGELIRPYLDCAPPEPELFIATGGLGGRTYF